MSSSGADDLFGQSWGSAPTGPSTPAAPVNPGPAAPGSFGAPPATGFGTAPAGLDNGFGGAFGGAPGGGPQSSAAFSVVHPPLVWLYAAAGAGLVALVLVLVFWGVVPLAIVGWVLGGPIAIALTSIFQSVDTARRTQIGYSTGRNALAKTLYIAALALGLAAVVVAAVTLAVWAGRGF